MLDSKPSGAVGALISDSAWHSPWNIEACVHISTNLASQASLRTTKNNAARSLLLESFGAHISDALTLGHEKSAQFLSSHQTLTDSFDTAGKAFTNLADILSTARTQMIESATYATKRATALAAKDDIPAAQDVLDTARAEIDAIGVELGQNIDRVLKTVTVPITGNTNR